MDNSGIIVGAHSLSWGTNLPQEAMFKRAEKAKELGCGAFEVFLSGNLGPTLAIKEAVEKFGLTPIGCAVIRDGVDGDPLSTDEGARKKAEETIKRHISAIHDIGGSLLVGPLANVLAKPGARPPSCYEFEAGVKTFRNVAAFADANKVKVAIEPLQWSEMPWPNTVQQVLDFIVLVEEGHHILRRRLGVLADTYHMNRMEENYLTALEKALEADRLYHMHVAGPSRTPPRLDQHIDWKKIVSTLEEANWGQGWSGTITIESFGAECDLPFEVVGPGNRLPAEEVIATGVATLRDAGL